MAALARLTASIAHEIRNPLGAISNAAQLLAESIADNPQDMRLVEIISGHCIRMNGIIENITQLARRDRVDQININLYDWTREFKQQFIHTIKIEENAVAVTGDKQLEVTVDPDQLYQVVMNLCQNAYRHCPPYTDTPVITLETIAPGESSWTLQILAAAYRQILPKVYLIPFIQLQVQALG